MANPKKMKKKLIAAFTWSPLLSGLEARREWLLQKEAVDYVDFFYRHRQARQDVSGRHHPRPAWCN